MKIMTERNPGGTTVGIDLPKNIFVTAWDRRARQDDAETPGKVTEVVAGIGPCPAGPGAAPVLDRRQDAAGQDHQARRRLSAHAAGPWPPRLAGAGTTTTFAFANSRDDDFDGQQPAPELLARPPYR